ncbi:hypothetical protein [Caldimonas brevitalea]|uniref:hypothetical protein n=1 Tax=Caldimonas brevitalea TaxID=413882 RepID=UPI0012FC145A|nr:hypothetical protein [Caldimonas brevitalea]
MRVASACAVRIDAITAQRCIVARWSTATAPSHPHPDCLFMQGGSSLGENMLHTAIKTAAILLLAASFNAGAAPVPTVETVTTVEGRTGWCGPLAPAGPWCAAHAD